MPETTDMEQRRGAGVRTGLSEVESVEAPPTPPPFRVFCDKHEVWHLQWDECFQCFMERKEGERWP